MIAGRGDKPVNYVGFYDAMRFANWLNNGQGSDTETGAYTLLGGTPTPSNGLGVMRNVGATIFLPSEDEWFKAAYHNALGLTATDYFAYPASSDTQPACDFPTAAANRANCGLGDATDVGSYTGSASPHGTFDQGGNVQEWTETILASNQARIQRGGDYNGSPVRMRVDGRGDAEPNDQRHSTGFRVAMIPEPGTGLLVMIGVLGLAGWRRRCA